MKTWFALVAISVAGVALVAAPSLASGGSTEIISLNNSGELGTNGSGGGAVSKGGRFVVFGSHATNLIPNDTNEARDIFVRSRKAGTTERVSVSSTGEQSNGFSFDVAISSNGRFVVFNSQASNLVANDTNDEVDTFLRDRRTGETSLISVNPLGEPGDDASVDGLDISADGRYVAFSSMADDLTDDPATGHFEVYVRDLERGLTERITIARDGGASNGPDQPEGSISLKPSISNDGRFVAFASPASNLVRHDKNESPDVFVRDRVTAHTVLVSRGDDGFAADGKSKAPDLSADGRHISFSSDAGNLVPRDTNEQDDVFVHNLVNGATHRISLLPYGNEAHFQLSAPSSSAITTHGQYVAFTYWAPLLPSVEGGHGRVYLWDRATKRLELISVNDDGVPATKHMGLDGISPHGVFVAFYGNAGNMAPGPNDVSQAFLRIRTP